MREYFAHRSLYHLKEGDPHAWAIPRLTGQAKASFVAVEFDEYGGGRGERVHQQLFAELLDAAGLDSSYLGYLNDISADSLAVVNLMSLFGLHRELRGAAVGHFASTEITSSPGCDGWWRRWSGWARLNRVSAFIASMWWPTPFTSRWEAPHHLLVYGIGHHMLAVERHARFGRAPSAPVPPSAVANPVRT